MEVSDQSWLIQFSLILIIFVLGLIIPFLTKPTIVFGSRIPAGKTASDEIRQIKLTFRRVYFIVMIPLLIILSWTVFSIDASFISAAGVLLQLLLIIVLYAIFNRKVRELKKSFAKDTVKKEIYEQIAVIDTEFRRQKYLVSLWWFLPSLIVVIFCFLLTYFNFDKIPNSIPTRFDLSGQAVQFMNKSGINVYLIPALSLFNVILFVGIYFGIKRAKQEIEPGNPEKTKLQNRQFRYIWSVFLAASTFILSVFFMFLILYSENLFNIPGTVFEIVNIVIPFSILVFGVLLAVKTGQSGNRLKIKPVEVPSDDIHFDDDKYWKLGVFYFNRNDPSFLIEKRIGVGWTINFGNPFAVITFILVIAIPMILHFILK